MGIRYFASPVSPRQIEQSHECPRECFDGDDAWDHWGPGREPTLDLDKCYPELQWLLGGDRPRRSYALVRGETRQSRYGWESFHRLLDPSETRAIAADLDELLAAPDQLATIGCRFGDRSDHAHEDLRRAQAFTTRVADAGFGIHYRIG
ncbi:hypothetical protein L2X99_13180 [Microbacterium sp. KUDC0406]|uniref:hypothetical protein n=1 Tax=Microbacterium sp. KUDC0406 TaxID=2909588 RepID=UPI001F1E5183|nr:hypothetical protein [Microbacterium sp. KUDC0406]UJP09375.1 hypothetical protein L2X99_13180 [Microbacterium sp. KUDC0406]